MRKPIVKPRVLSREVNKKRIGSERFGSYKMALHRPFADEALGARVPDMYSAPTVTYHTKGTVSVASNTLGVASLLLTPNPLASMIDMTTASVSATSMYNYVGASSVYAATSLVNLQNAFASYRVVGMGIRLKCIQAPTTAVGRLIVAPFNTSTGGPGPASLGSVSWQNQQLAQLFGSPFVGSSTTTGLPATIIELPCSQEYTLQDMITNTVEFWAKPVGPGAFEFHNLYNVTAITGQATYQNLQSATVINGVVSTAGNDLEDTSSFKGWQGVLIRGEGLTASTTAFEVEYIYHFEGTPASPTTVAGQIVPTVPANTHIDIVGFHNTLSNVLGDQPIKLIAEYLTKQATDYYTGGGGKKLINTMMARMGLSV